MFHLMSLCITKYINARTFFFNRKNSVYRSSLPVARLIGNFPSIASEFTVHLKLPQEKIKEMGDGGKSANTSFFKFRYKSM